MSWSMPSSLLMLLYFWYSVGFFFCSASTYLEQLFTPTEFLYMMLKYVSSFLLDQNSLWVIPSYVLCSPMFFKPFFKIIGPMVSSFLYQMSLVLCSFCNTVDKFLKVLKVSLVVLDLNSCFSPFKSFLGYFLSASFVFNNMNSYISYFFDSRLDQLVKLISFSIVTMISLLVILVMYFLMHHSVILKYVITVLF